MKNDTTLKYKKSDTENETNIVKKYCKKGTRKNKDGNCEPIILEKGGTKTEIYQNDGIVALDEPIVKKHCKRGTRKNKYGDCESIRVNQQLTIQKNLDTETNTDDYDYDDNDNAEDESFPNNIEMVNFEYTESNKDFDFLYTDLDNPHFLIKNAKEKEFNDTQYDGTLYNIKKQAKYIM